MKVYRKKDIRNQEKNLFEIMSDRTDKFSFLGFFPHFFLSLLHFYHFPFFNIPAAPLIYFYCN